MKKRKAAPKAKAVKKTAPTVDKQTAVDLHDVFVKALQTHSAIEAERKNPKLYWCPAEGCWKTE